LNTAAKASTCFEKAMAALGAASLAIALTAIVYNSHTTPPKSFDPEFPISNCLLQTWTSDTWPAEPVRDPATCTQAGKDHLADINARWAQVNAAETAETACLHQAVPEATREKLNSLSPEELARTPRTRASRPATRPRRKMSRHCGLTERSLLATSSGQSAG
jgi:hypothetical protein